MAAAPWYRYLYLAHLSRPKSVRKLYRLVHRQAAARIVEVGISDLRRSLAIIEIAQRTAGEQTVFYTAIDWFDSRAHGLEPLALKDAYRQLRATGATVRLVPGAPGAGLAAAANAHQNTDLILMASPLTEEDLQRAWFYVPRMLHANSLVLREQASAEGPEFASVSRTEIAELAGRAAPRRAA